jgi:hypothetical protein
MDNDRPIHSFLDSHHGHGHGNERMFQERMAWGWRKKRSLSGLFKFLSTTPVEEEKKVEEKKQ